MKGQYDTHLLPLVDIEWINQVPKFLRRRFVKDTFKNLKWYDSSEKFYVRCAERWVNPGYKIERSYIPDAYAEDYELLRSQRDLVVQVGTSGFLIGAETLSRECMPICGMCGYYYRYRVIASAGGYTAGFEVLVHGARAGDGNERVVCYADELEEPKVNVVSYSAHGHGTMIDERDPCVCEQCRRVRYVERGLAHIAQQIDECVHNVTTADIRMGLEILRTRASKFTFACIWWLRWRETGLPQVPRDVIKMILALM